MGAKGSGAWTEALGEAFLALMRETGNARAAARTLGHRHLFNNRMKRDPAFRRDCAAAAAEADARLSQATSPFLRPIEVKSLPEDPDSLGGILRPGRKRPQTRPEPVIRRTSTGRLQLTLALDGHWTSEIEADFLARLRATGNFRRSALAVGFQPASVIDRTRKWAAFASDCRRALEEASVKLDYALVAHAHALLRRPGEATEDGEEEEDVPFDPIMAMKILSHIDARKFGRSGRGPRKGPPERSFEEAVKSILTKIEAIERHEKMIRDSHK